MGYSCLLVCSRAVRCSDPRKTLGLGNQRYVSRGRDTCPGAYLFVVLGTSNLPDVVRYLMMLNGAQAAKPKCALYITYNIPASLAMSRLLYMFLYYCIL